MTYSDPAGSTLAAGAAEMDAIPRRHDDQSAWSSSAKLAAAAAAAAEKLIYDTLMYRRPTFIGRTQW